jgi:hypothetical protein
VNNFKHIEIRIRLRGQSNDDTSAFHYVTKPVVGDTPESIVGELAGEIYDVVSEAVKHAGFEYPSSPEPSQEN